VSVSCVLSLLLIFYYIFLPRLFSMNYPLHMGFFCLFFGGGDRSLIHVLTVYYEAAMLVGEVLKRHDEVSAIDPADAKTNALDEAKITKYVAMDCEMVGIGPGGVQNALGRCSIVNYYGEVLYDHFVKVTDEITDYRTHVSGIRYRDLVGPKSVDFASCQQAVAKIFKSRIVVGHALSNDFQALLLSHPRKQVRDTSRCKLLCPDRPVGLRKLLQRHLGTDIQKGEHNSVGIAQ